MLVRAVLILFSLGAAASALLGAAASAAPKRLTLDAANTEIGFRVYGFGLVPVDGQFARVQGVLTSDASDPAACALEVSAEVDSLSMPTADMRETALAPGLLDAAAHPRMSFHGVCRGRVLQGELSLHGLVGAMEFDLTRHGEALEAEGRLRRADWGMTGSSALVGQTVRIRIALHNPATPGG